MMNVSKGMRNGGHFNAVCQMALAILWALTAPACAQSRAGQPELSLAGVTWVHGGPIAMGESTRGKVVLLDLWTTWCPPCRTALNERIDLQRRLGPAGLVVVGVSHERPDVVSSFLETVPGEVNIALACDNEGGVYEDLLGAEGLRTVPYAVIINRDGEVVWRGEPGPDLAGTVERVVDGTFDVAAARRKAAEKKRAAETMQMIQQAARQGDCDELMSLCGRATDIDVEAAGADVVANALNVAAWALLTEDACQGRFAKQVVPFASKAVELTGWKNAAIIDTYARALFDAGDVRGAVGAQRKAVALLTGTGPNHPFVKVLREYEQSLPESERSAAGAGGPDAQHPKPADTQEQRRPKQSLSQVEAAEDLRFLHDLLKAQYGGYADIEWSLASSGGWASRTKKFVDRLESRDTWKTDELFGVVVDYLEPVEDAHFWIEGPEGKPSRRHLLTRHQAFVTDLRIERHDDGYVIGEAPDKLQAIVGHAVSQVPVVSLDNIALNKPFLLPTVPGPDGRAAYLIGRFQQGLPAGEIELSLESPEGEARKVSLALHRLRSMKGMQPGKAWQLCRPPDCPYPTVYVRSSVPSRLEGFVESAPKLRSEEVLVVDLRGNTGGSDTPVMQWCSGLSQQPYYWRPAANRDAGGGWSCFLPTNLASFMSAHKPDGERFAGRLFVITDRSVASGGETFASLVMQIPGAVVLGENTAGCTAYGNASIVKALPHSGITVRFGRTHFVMEAIQPIKEGVGFLPGYWLDEEEPFEAIERLLAQAP